MRIYGYTPKTWRNKAIIYWNNTNKLAFGLFAIWSIGLFLV